MKVTSMDEREKNFKILIEEGWFRFCLGENPLIPETGLRNPQNGFASLI